MGFDSAAEPDGRHLWNRRACVPSRALPIREKPETLIVGRNARRSSESLDKRVCMVYNKKQGISLTGKHRPGIAGSVPERMPEGRDAGLIHGPAY